MAHFRKYKLNEHYFDKIDSGEKAYWLGFLMADGFVSKYALGLELSKIDIDHIKKFIKAIKSQHPIRNTAKNCCLVSMGSKYLIDTISQYGLIKNKTYKPMVPKIKPKLMVDFFRGILDGDGWITSRSMPSTKKMKKRTYEIGFSSADKDFLLIIQNWICDQINRKCGYIISRKRWNGSVAQLTIGGNILFSLLYELFYKNAKIFLNRKKEKADLAMKNIAIWQKHDGRKFTKT